LEEKKDQQNEQPRKGACKSAKQMIQDARAAGQDALGIANDPESIEAIAQITCERGNPELADQMEADAKKIRDSWKT
jgi:hypothetical protein